MSACLGSLFSKISLFRQFHIIHKATKNISNLGVWSVCVATSITSVNEICRGSLNEFPKGACCQMAWANEHSHRRWVQDSAASKHSTQENVFKIFLSKSFVRRGRLSVHALQMKFLILGGIITDQTCFQKECCLPTSEVEAIFPLAASSISFWRKYALRTEKTPL